MGIEMLLTEGIVNFTHHRREFALLVKNEVKTHRIKDIPEHPRHGDKERFLISPLKSVRLQQSAELFYDRTGPRAEVIALP